MYLYCQLNVYVLSIECICTVNWMYMYCQLNVYVLSIECICTVNWMYMYCQLNVYVLSIECICTVISCIRAVGQQTVFTASLQLLVVRGIWKRLENKEALLKRVNWTSLMDTRPLWIMSPYIMNFDCYMYFRHHFQGHNVLNIVSQYQQRQNMPR